MPLGERQKPALKVYVRHNQNAGLSLMREKMQQDGEERARKMQQHLMPRPGQRHQTMRCILFPDAHFDITGGKENLQFSNLFLF